MNNTKFKDSFKFSTSDIALMGVLIAAEVVLSRFLSISLWNMKIGFAFVPLVIGAMMLGPLKAGIIALVADFLGAMLFPIGTYFPGFTLSAFLRGLTFGIFLYKDQDLKKISLAVLINQIFFSLLLNTLWISILYGSPYKAVFVSRLPQTALLIVAQILVSNLIVKTAGKTLNSYKR